LQAILGSAPIPLSLTFSVFTEENLIHSDLLFLSANHKNSKKTDEATLVQCALIIELVRTTLSLHQKIQGSAVGPSVLVSENQIKRLILEGDYLFMMALSLVPKLNQPLVERRIHRAIEKACSGYLSGSLTSGLQQKNIPWFYRLGYWFQKKNQLEHSALIELALTLDSESEKTVGVYTTELGRFSKQFSQIYGLRFEKKGTQKMEVEKNKCSLSFNKSPIVELVGQCLALV
jgi:hypothetical protein